jgi:hypothetical protein
MSITAVDGVLDTLVLAKILAGRLLLRPNGQGGPLGLTALFQLLVAAVVRCAFHPFSIPQSVSLSQSG